MLFKMITQDSDWFNYYGFVMAAFILKDSIKQVDGSCLELVMSGSLKLAINKQNLLKGLTLLDSSEGLYYLKHG